MKYEKSEKLTFEISICVKKRQNKFFIRSVLASEEVSFYLRIIKNCDKLSVTNWSESELKKQVSEVRN